MEAYRKIILALDGIERWDIALETVKRLCDTPDGPLIGGVKLHELVHHYGLVIVRNMPLSVMVDMKIWEIPSKVFSHTKKFAGLCRFLTIHAQGDGAAERVQAARAAAEGTDTKVIAVLRLTSEAEDQNCSVAQELLQGARMAMCAGAHGTVCSGHELPLFMTSEFDGFLRIVPGIRPAGVVVPDDDQKRFVTPTQAIERGAHHLVVGRPIMRASDPVDAARKIKEEIDLILA